MSNRKSIVVTVIVAVMLAVIVYSAWRMQNGAFPVLLGLLAVYGFAAAAGGFCRWLRRESPVLPPDVQDAEFYPLRPDWVDRGTRR